MKYSPRFIAKLALQTRHGKVPDFSIPMSYGLLNSMKKSLSKPASHIICGSGVWILLMSDATVGALVDPPLEVREIESGYLGTLLECDIISDSFLPDGGRILHPNFLALVSLQSFDQDTWQTECPIVVIEDYKSVHLCR